MPSGRGEPMASEDPPPERESTAAARRGVETGWRLLAERGLTDPRQGRRRAQVRRFVRPAERFIRLEGAGGVVIVIAVLLALIWANSPWSERYHEILGTHLSVDAWLWSLDESLKHWIDDALMVVFFFVVGLEIKREIVLGELSSPRRLAVPLVAAAGGMIVPVLVFILLVDAEEARRGWAIPMATDIAIALGVLALLGTRIPTGLKALLLGVAIVDDIGGVLVIAVFYTQSLDYTALLVVGCVVIATILFTRYGVRPVYVYIALGGVGWAATTASGIHPTIFGVVMGLITPARPLYAPAAFGEVAERVIGQFWRARDVPDRVERREREADALHSLSTIATETVAPLDRLEHTLVPWTAFLVVPVFAFANAGVDLRDGALQGALSSSLALGVGMGLVLGKPLGITLGAWLAVRLGGSLPRGVSWGQIAAMGLIAGIGFTVALFITDLSYPPEVIGARSAEVLLREAKVGILIGSVLAAVVGLLALAAVSRPRRG